MVLLKTILNFDSIQYMKEAYVKPIVIAVIMSVLLFGYSYLDIMNPFVRLLSIVACFIITTAIVYYIGLTSGEKTKVVSMLKNKILKHGQH